MVPDVRRLRLLREVARCGTIAGAAAALHLSAPAVSQQLAILEREVGARLFERQARAIRLTSSAWSLVARAETILAELEAAMADLDQAEGHFGGELRCGAFPTAMPTLLGPVLASLQRLHPAIVISAEELEPDQALSELSTGRLDLAIAHEYDRVPRRNPTTLHRRDLLTEPMYVVLPLDHWQARQPGAVDLAVLSEEWWIAPPDGLTCFEELRRTCAAAGFEPRVRCRSYTYETMYALVAAGLGVALVPGLARRPRDAGTRARLVREPSAKRSVFVAVRSGAEQRPSVAAALDELAHAARSLQSG